MERKAKTRTFPYNKQSKSIQKKKRLKRMKFKTNSLWGNFNDFFSIEMEKVSRSLIKKEKKNNKKKQRQFITLKKRTISKLK